jgi:hypothetical protein
VCLFSIDGFNILFITPIAKFVVFTVVKIEAEVFWVVALFGVVVGCQHSGGPCCFHHEDGGSMNLQNNGILPQHYMMSQPRRPQLEVKTSNLVYSIFCRVC